MRCRSGRSGQQGAVRVAATFTVLLFLGFVASTAVAGPSAAPAQAITSVLPTITTTLPISTPLPPITTTLPKVTTTVKVTTTLPKVTTTLPKVTTTPPKVTTQTPPTPHDHAEDYDCGPEDGPDQPYHCAELGHVGTGWNDPVTPEPNVSAGTVRATSGPAAAGMSTPPRRVAAVPRLQRLRTFAAPDPSSSCTARKRGAFRFSCSAFATGGGFGSPWSKLSLALSSRWPFHGARPRWRQPLPLQRSRSRRKPLPGGTYQIGLRARRGRLLRVTIAIFDSVVSSPSVVAAAKKRNVCGASTSFSSSQGFDLGGVDGKGRQPPSRPRRVYRIMFSASMSPGWRHKGCSRKSPRARLGQSRWVWRYSFSVWR